MSNKRMLYPINASKLLIHLKRYVLPIFFSLLRMICEDVSFDLDWFDPILLISLDRFQPILLVPSNPINSPIWLIPFGLSIYWFQVTDIILLIPMLCMATLPISLLYRGDALPMIRSIQTNALSDQPISSNRWFHPTRFSSELWFHPTRISSDWWCLVAI